MSLPVPLAVRMVTSNQDRNVTGDVDDLTFRTVVPGGFASATFSLHRPLHFHPNEIAAFGRVYVYDGRNGNVVWEGRLEDPGMSVNGSGAVWSLSALGPSAHAQDISAPVVYAVGGVSPLFRTDQTTFDDFTGPTSVGTLPGGLRERVDRDTVVAPGEYLHMLSDTFWQLGQTIGLVAWDWRSGKVDANWQMGFVYGQIGGSVTEILTRTFTTTNQSRAVYVNGAGLAALPANQNLFGWRVTRLNSSGTVADGATYLDVDSVTVMASRLNADGTPVMSGYATTLYATDVVKDLLARRLPQYDVNSAVITATTRQYGHYLHLDPVTAAQILADFMVGEPAYYWAAWESQANGRYRFEWTTWPTVAGIDATAADGFDDPGTAAELYNAVNVHFTSTHGYESWVRRTSSVPILDDAGIVRETTIDASSKIRTTADANDYGDAFLEAHASVTSGATLTIRRPVLDLESGRTLQPWEVRPGRIVRIRDINATTNGATGQTPNGVDVFRIVSVDYSARDNSASCELDTYPRTVSRALAKRR